MARLSPLRVGLALAYVFIINHDVATASEVKCRTGCQGVTPRTFRYAEGTTYKYNFEGNIDITLSTAEGQQISTKVTAIVLLTQQPNCNQVLQIQNLHVVGPSAKKFRNLPNIEKPVQLNFHDGHVEDIICSEPEDTQHSLNVKRAIVTLFQAAQRHSYETDVFGVCPTELSTRKEGNIVTITKSKNLNKCAHRESIQQDFIATSFNLNSEVKSSPILNADYSSEQRIKNGILDHVIATENYLYVPFSLGQNGAKATVTAKLQYTGQSKDVPKIKCTVPKSIIFENPHLVNAEKGNVNSILAALKETKDTIHQTVGETTAQHFSNLIKIVRVSTKDDLLSVYGQVKAGAGFKDKEGAKKLYLDALLRAGAGDTIAVTIELLKNKELNEVEQKLVYLGLAFVKHATPAALNSATSLLDQPHLPREAYLGIGTLAGRYCHGHPCKGEESFNKLAQKLASKLGDGKAGNRVEEDEIVLVLKAIANIRYLSDAIVSKIVGIAQDKKAPSRVRVAALEAYLADACKDKIRDSAINILKDIQQDSEVRIKAYLAATQCPNGKVANAVKTLLDTEPSYQVGGFIASHLRSIRASTNPDKELAKQQLGLIHTTKKYPFDFRKYSYNTEFSYNVDTLGLSSVVESNVIFSQNSFLPRSTSLNLTAEVFGHTFNFLEIGTRQENLDKILEHYFGPLGVLKGSEKVQEFSAAKKAVAKKLYEHVKERYSKSTRGKRDVTKAEIDSAAKQTHLKTNQLNNDLDLDLSVKLFGSEFLFLSLNENTQKYTPEAIIDKIFDRLDDGIEKAKEFEHTIRSNLLFLDTELSYPTALGFPLRLNVQGTAAVQIKAAGSIDIRALLNQNTDTGIKFTLIPSANIEVAGSLTLDSYFVDTGLKVTSTLYTATGGSLEVQLFNHGSGLDVKFSVPVEKLNLVSATHNIVFSTREPGNSEVRLPVKFPTNKEYSICFDQLSPVIGLTFCGDITGPPANQPRVLPFPFNGNHKVSLTIERDDISQYHYRHVLTSDPNKFGVDVVLEALGGKKDKTLSFQVEAYVTPGPYIKATLVSSIKTAVLEGRITNTDTEKSILVKFGHDTEEYYGKIGVSVSGNAAKSAYKPLVEYKTPGSNGAQKSPYTVEGQIIVEQSGNNVKYTFDNVKLSFPNLPPYSIKGNLGQEGDSYFTDVTVTDSKLSVSVNGKMQFQKNLLKINGEIKNTHNPHANINLKYEFKKQPDQLDNFLQIIHGQDLSSKEKILTLYSSIYNKNLRTKEDYKAGKIDFGTKNKFSYPLLGVESKFDLAATTNTLKYDVEYRYNELKFGSELDVKLAKNVLGDYDIEFKVYVLDSKLEFDAKREISGEKSKIENSLEVNGKKFKVDGTVTHHVKPNDVNVGAELTIKLPDTSEAIKFSQAFVLNPSEVDTFLKITQGGKAYIDAFLKGTKGGNANGSLKIAVATVTANGQIKAVKGVGNGHVVIEFLKINRKIKGETSFTISEPTFNVAATLYTDFEKDNKKKLSFTSNNHITLEAIDSKNNVDIYGKNIEANVKGSKHGNYWNGKITGEAELILPTDHYLAGKFQRDVHTKEGVSHGTLFWSLEQRDNKNAPGRKISVKGTAKGVNFKAKVFDITYNIVAENGQGKVLNSDVVLKHVPQGDKFASELKVKAHGSVLSSPFEAGTTSVYKKFVGTYQILAKYGDKASITVDGKYDLLGHGTPYSSEVSVEIHTPSTKLETIKFNAGGSILRPSSFDDYLEVKVNGGLSVDGTQKETNVNVKGVGELKVSAKNGEVKGTLNYNQEEPISVALGYDHSELKDGHKLNANLFVQYAKDKSVKADATISKSNPYEYHIDLKLDTPGLKTEHTRIELNTKKSSDGKIISNDLVLHVNDKKIVLTNELVISETAPSFNVLLKYPDGHTDQISAKVTKLGPKHVGGELKIVYESGKAVFKSGPFYFDGSVDANTESVDDFNIKVTLNSESLKLDHVVVEAHNKPAKTGKRIQISAKSGDKNLFTGSTSYKAHEEGSKYIIEGSGSFKVKEETKSANFKYIRQNLNYEKNGEEGIEISFNAALGSKAIDTEFKITNKQFRILESYCEEKKQCAHIEIDSKTNTADLTVFNHELEVAVDLRKLGLSHEFGLKAVTNRDNFVIDHTVDIHFQSQENSKYQYSLYVHPKEAGLSLTTPKRVISVEATVEAPKTKGTSQFIKGDVSVYLNKKAQPNQKTSLTFLLTSSNEVSQGSAQGSVKFSNPSLGKDLLASFDIKYGDSGKSSEGTVIIDVFAKANDKIIITGKESLSKQGDGYYASVNYYVKSQGLDVDIAVEESASFVKEQRAFEYKFKALTNVGKAKYNSLINVHSNPQEVAFSAKILNRDIFSWLSKLQLSKESQVIDTTVTLIGLKPSASHLEVKNFNTVKFSGYYKDAPNDKIEFNSGFIIGQIADVRADVYKAGTKHNLVHATVKLDEANFLKSDYGVSLKNVQNYLLVPVRGEVVAFYKAVRKELETVFKELTGHCQQFIEILKANGPNLKPLRDYFQEELNKLREELVSDKTIKEITDFLKGIFGAAAQAISEILARVSELLEKISHTLQANFSKVLEIISNELLPKLKELAEKFLDLFANILEKVADLFFTYLAKISEILDAHQEELKQIATSLSAIGQDFGRFVVKTYEQIRALLLKEWNNVYQEIKALPIYEEIKNKYTEIFGDISVSENLINTFKDAVATAKDALPNEDLKNLVDVVASYIEKKLRREKVDDIAAIENIIKSVVTLFKKILVSLEVKDLQFVKKTVPVSLDFLTKLPKLVAVKFSPFNYIASGDLPDILDFLFSLSFNPKLWIPPFELHALIVQGQHVFTFGGKHLTFPGKCSYLYAHDAVNGNFSITGTLTDGILTAITLSDKTDAITYKKGGQVLVNNVATEFPAGKSSLIAFRTYESVNLFSLAGVKVICGPELVACGVYVSGFYHGQLRGLLGRGNNEPYDDFTLPNGKIVTSESEFGNAFKVGSSCPAVKTVDHGSHHHSPSCSKLFGPDSSLRACYKFVNPENYRMACDHGVAAGVKDTEFAVAVGYVAACNNKFIPIHVPDEFVKCQNGDKPFTVDEKFSVKTPGKAADVVIIVDRSKPVETLYKELVQPLIPQLTHEFNAKGVNDVHYHLIGYRGEQDLYPVHYTFGGKLDFKGKGTNIKFTESPKPAAINVGCSKLNSILEYLRDLCHDIHLVTGYNVQARTYTEALKYPFRAHAVKSLIIVNGDQCEQGRFLPLQKLRALLFRNKGISINLITTFRDFKAKDSKHTKNVIGFNAENVFTFSDGKKKPTGSSEFRKELEYDDFCVDFTLQNRGNVFVANNFAQAKSGAKKTYIQAVAHNVADVLVSVEQGLDCECKFVSPFSAQNVCKVVHTYPKATPQKGG